MTDTAQAREHVERVAKAIYDAEDPNSGDAIAVTIHCTEHIPPHGDLAEQLEQVMDTCRAAATAALTAMQPEIDALQARLATAEALIAALQSPTPEMMNAGDEVVDTWTYGHTVSTSELAEAYTAIVTAALPDHVGGLDEMR